MTDDAMITKRIKTAIKKMMKKIFAIMPVSSSQANTP